MTEPTSAITRAPLKEPDRRPREGTNEGEEESGSRFETLIPSDSRRSLFKQKKGRLGMG